MTDLVPSDHRRQLTDANTPAYPISVVADLTGLHEQTLRAWERDGLVRPARTGGRQRLYSQRDLERIQTVQHLLDERGLNRAGAKLALEMADTIEQQQQRIDQLEHTIAAVRDHLAAQRRDRPHRTGGRQPAQPALGQGAVQKATPLPPPEMREQT